MAATIHSSPKQETLLRSARVLVVDDLTDTRERICKALEPYVGDARGCAPGEIRGVTMYGREKPDLILTDLRFPPESDKAERRSWSWSPPRHGLALLKELGTDCPPCTIFTGSISSADFARLQSQAVSSDGTPAARFVLKSSGLQALTEQMEGALQDAARLSPSVRARILASLPEPTFDLNHRFDRENAVALAAEKLSNFLFALSRSIDILKSDCGLESWPCWKQVSAALIPEANALSVFNARRFLGSSPRETLGALHEVLGRFLLLDPEMLAVPADLEAGKSKLAREVISRISDGYATARNDIAQCFDGFRIQAKGLFSLDEKLRSLFPDSKSDRTDSIYYYRKEFKDTTRIPDPDGSIQKFLRGVNDSLAGEMYFLEIRYCDGEYTMGNAKALRERINWGSGYHFSLRVMSDEMPVWQYLEPLRYAMKELSDAKVLYINPCEFQTQDLGLNQFKFYIKASDIDAAAEVNEQARIGSIGVTPLKKIEAGKDIFELSRVAVASGEFIAINFEPQRLTKIGGCLTAVEHEGTLFIASARSHTECDRALYFALRSQFALERWDAIEAARLSVRLKHEYEKCWIAEDECPESPKLRPALSDLGLIIRRGSDYEVLTRVELSGMWVRDNRDEE